LTYDFLSSAFSQVGFFSISRSIKSTNSIAFHPIDQKQCVSMTVLRQEVSGPPPQLEKPRIQLFANKVIGCGGPCFYCPFASAHGSARGCIKQISGVFLSLSSLAGSALALAASSAGGRQSRVVARVTEGSALRRVTCRGAGVQQARALGSILCCPLTSEGNAADRLSKGTHRPISR
jgi:hypothetical protein